jgi:thiamine-phosphate pyrophosphorylase
VVTPAGEGRGFGETAANQPLTAAISPKPALPGRAPRLLVVTDRRQAAGELIDVIAAAVTGGARHVLLRERDLPTAQRLALAQRLRTILAEVGGQLIVAGPDPLCGYGSGLELAVHLSAYDPGPGEPGGPPRAATLVGRSCHHGDELPSTVDYITMSPVFASRSKPGYGPALGVDGLRRATRRTTSPVLALGGVESPAQLVACRAAGAYGVAVMGAVMRSTTPQRIVRDLLTAELDTQCDALPADSSTVMP